MGLVLLLLSAPVAAEEPASRTFAASCADVRPVALAKLKERGFDVAPSPACPDCYHLQSRRLQDADGHALASVRTMMNRYMTVHDSRDTPGAWYVHSGLTTRGDLRLAPAGNGCRAQLLFHYTWYATEFLVVVPVDGDPASRPSNLKLESQYLDRIAQQIAARPHN